MAATSFQQVTAMLVELNPQIFKKEVFCISSKGFNQRDAYRVMLRKYPDVMNIEQMCDALRISTKTGYKLLHEGKIPAMKIGRSYRIPKAHLFTYLRFAVNTVEQRIDSVDCFAPMRYAVLVNSRSGATQTEGGIYLWSQGICKKKMVSIMWY